MAQRAAPQTAALDGHAAPRAGAESVVGSPPAGAQLPGASPPAPSVHQDPDGSLEAGRDAPVGGQAVLEGVMMRGVGHWAVAVRKPPATSTGAVPEADAHDAPADEGEIEVKSFPLDSALRRHRILRLPIIRGVVALGGSLAIGFRALEMSANAQLDLGAGGRLEGGELDQADGDREDAGPQEIPKGVWAGTVFVALALAIVLFFLVPVGLTSLIKGQLGSSVLFWIVEGLVRTGIFLGYLVLLSRIRDLRRVFEYHGAEHKTISCFESGLPLTPANAQRFSRLHPRCGTSFLLIVMIVAIFVFAPIGLPAWYWLFATRILGVPLIAGISFEVIKFAGRNRSRRWVRALMWPGMQLQLLTTREPDLPQLEVAIAALGAVLARERPGELSAADLVGVEVVA
jgi:uncharacterized protein YqhQ